jgi:hypothetical protein
MQPTLATAGVDAPAASAFPSARCPSQAAWEARARSLPDLFLPADGSPSRGFMDRRTAGAGAGVSLDAERAAASFDVQELMHLLYGGPQVRPAGRGFTQCSLCMQNNNCCTNFPRTSSSFHLLSCAYALVSPSDTRSQKLARRRELQAVIENDPAFRKWDVPFLSRSERMRRAREKAAAAVGHVRRLGLEDPLELAAFFSHIDDLLPTELHRSMFTPTLAAQASDEQQAHWMPLAREYKIIGTYAQTELGHGSFVRGMETTATFDVDADAFVLNTPTLTSTKWCANTHAHSAHKSKTMMRCFR